MLTVFASKSFTISTHLYFRTTLARDTYVQHVHVLPTTGPFMALPTANEAKEWTLYTKISEYDDMYYTSLTLSTAQCSEGISYHCLMS